jgi:endoglucanase
MKKALTLISSLLVAGIVILTSFSSGQTSPFHVQRGLNVSHWFAQSSTPITESDYVTQADFALIAELGFDHVRLPVDEWQLFDEDGNKREGAFRRLHEAIRWSFASGLRMVIDLHTLRSHHFNIEDRRTLWTSADAQARFIGLWLALSEELSRYPTDSLAYELLNEAVSADPENWNRLLNTTIERLRELEPTRTIFVGSNNWQIPSTFRDLRIPEDDPNLVLSFHFYTPFLFTHYRTPWSSVGPYEGPVVYPGVSVDSSQYAGLPEALVKQLQEHNRFFDGGALEADILQAVRAAEHYGLPLYCGEYGAYPSTSIEMRKAWYRDMHAIFDRHGVSWAHWNYKNDFPVVDESGKPVRELLDIMLADSRTR